MEIRGRVTSWDLPDSHWDIDDGSGSRQRYNRWGVKITAGTAHGGYKGPKRKPVSVKTHGRTSLGVIGGVLFIISGSQQAKALVAQYNMACQKRNPVEIKTAASDIANFFPGMFDKHRLELRSVLLKSAARATRLDLKDRFGDY